MTWIQTYTGKKFYPLAPRVEDIDIEDIAHALSNLCRFGGHSRWFYSVAQHSLLMSWLVPKEFALWALLHDASEAYLVDVPRPIKGELGGYREAEERLEHCIAERFGLSGPMPAAVKAADNSILMDEAKALLGDPPEEWDAKYEPLGVDIMPWPVEGTKAVFLKRFHQLTRVAA